MAERAGFRPCKRCRPGAPRPTARYAEIVARACRQIEEAEREPSLHELSEPAGMSSFHFHRVFRVVVGMTPKRYAAAHRHRKVQQTLRSRDTVTEALYEAGYNANSRFYADASQVLGMTPSAFRAGGVGATIRFAIGACTLGAVLVAQTERGLCAILLGDDPEKLLRELQDAFPRAVLVGGNAEFEATVAQVIGFVESPGVGLDLPLDVRGTAFQQRVWAVLRALPAGTTASYAAIAETMGMPKAVRAVAGACAANVLAVAIPCHRVVRTDGSLSGYRWGVERKRALLEREAR